MKQKKIIFISHEATRTGAPIVLLNFLKWFKENTNIPFEIVIYRGGGELESSFAALAPTTVIERPFSPTVAEAPSVIQRIRKKLRDKFAGFRVNLISEDSIGLIYVNSVVSGPLVKKFKSFKCPIITHVHELGYGFRCCDAQGIQLIKNHTTHFIACSQAVKKNLIETHSISPNDITVIHEFIPIQNTSEKNASLDQEEVFQKSVSPKASYLKKTIGIPDNAFVIGGSGAIGFRKGTDLFIQLAYRVRQKLNNAPIHFVWVGGMQGWWQALEIDHDLLNSGLSKVVHFTGSQPNPLDYFSGFDVFTLTSREDPYPLVCLEVASLGKPIICFDNAGGMPEFVEEDAGFVVPYLDLESMADKIAELYQSSELQRMKGQRARAKVAENHSIEDTAPKVLSLIKNFYQG